MSRNHAFIRRSQNGEYIVEDNNSKFGTLMQVRKPLLLDKRNTNYLQAGRTILELVVTELDYNCCLSLLGLRGNRKVQKNTLSKDEEGDLFPGEFMQKAIEFTREEDADCLNKFSHAQGSHNHTVLRPALGGGNVRDDFAGIVSVEDEGVSREGQQSNGQPEGGFERDSQPEFRNGSIEDQSERRSSVLGGDSDLDNSRSFLSRP